MEAPAQVVFDIVHDYDRRLQWDPFLRRAEIVNGDTAGVGVKTFCAVKYRLLGWGMLTQYVSFQPPDLAAVSMMKGPFFFEKFAASIRHKDLDSRRSEVTYRLNFRLKGPLLSLLGNRAMAWLLGWETQHRLRRLKVHAEANN